MANPSGGRTPSAWPAASKLEPEDETKGVVRPAASPPPAGRPSRRAVAGQARDLYQHAGLVAPQVDGGPERRRAGALGRGAPAPSQPHKLVGLHHDRVPVTPLLVAPSPLGSGQAKDLATNHSVADARRQLRHLLADRAHLLAVRRIFGQPADLLAQGRAGAATRCGFAECRADRLGVVEALRAHDIKRRSAGIVKAYMERPGHVVTVARTVLQPPGVTRRNG